MSGPAVLFDVDGTLVDSTYLHALAWWRALDDAGHRTPMAVLHRLIGMGGSELLQKVRGHDDESLRRGHSRHYQRLKGDLTALPGARDLLRTTREHGATVVLATSAEPHDLDDLLRVLDAEDHIDEIVTAGDVEAAKPAGDIFSAALSKAGCQPSEALAVGDTAWDVMAAGRAGVACVAVLTGGWSRDELLSSGAVAVYADSRQLRERFEESPLGRLAPLRRGGKQGKIEAARQE